MRRGRQVGRDDRDRRGRVGVDRQQRHERRAEPGARHRLDRAVVLGAEHEVRLDARRAQVVLDPAGAAAGPEADEPLLADELRATASAGEAASGEPAAVTEHERVAEELDGLERARRQRQHAEREVERRPAPTSSNRPSSLAASVRRTSTPGQACAKRPMIAGRTRVPTLWYTPTRSVPVSPAAYASRSARAAWSRSVIASTWRSSSRPASVSATVRRPRERSNSRTPSAASSAMTCWLTADCV